MMNNKYIIFLYYEYNHKTDIINIDNKLDKLINLTIYDKIYKYFSQIESRRYYVVSIYNLHIYKLIKILRFPFKIDSILKVLKGNLMQKDKYGFTKVNFDTSGNDELQLITTNNNDNDNEYHDNEYHDNEYHDNEYHDNEYHDNEYHDNEYHDNEYHDNEYHDNEYNDYQISKYKNYILEPENISVELYKMTNNLDKIVRIYGPEYDNIVPINFQLTEDLTIYVSLKTR
jgi:hypothetical protein